MDSFHPRITPWQIDEADFYEIEQREEQLRFLLQYAVLAPSGHNSQPWTFRITSEGVEVFADFERRLPAADPQDRELLMSIGAAIANLRIAAAHFGFETTALYQPGREESLPIALVAIRETCAPDPALSRLFPAITRRHTNRQAFQDRAIDETALSSVCDFIDENAAWLAFVVPHDRGSVAGLIDKADRILMSRDAYRHELADWMRPNESSATDGMCGDGFGIPGPLSALAPWMIRRLEASDVHARHDRSLAENAAGLIVVSADDDQTALLQAGEILERLLLHLTSVGLHYSFLNQPIEVDELRRELSQMVRSAKPPQLLLRIGYARPVAKAMPRRPLETVLVK
ncbi:MAG TPA: nitroreductase [Thermoanaerobaculia bacterium]|nr:nitroreductase [Thermoanaerobaculia bacterium]